jgi:hypothetical protein
MSGKQFWIAILVVIALGAALAAAQDEKNELSGVVGRTFLSTQGIQGATFFDPNIRFGRGLTVEGSYARRLLVTPLFAVAGELPVAYNPDEDLHAGGSSLVPKDYNALFVAPSVRVNLFPTTAVSLWGSFGGGFGHIGQSSSTLYGAPNLGKGTTSGVLQYGVGLDVRLVSRVFLRGEARDFWAGEPDFPQAPTGKSRQHNYFVGGGVMWRF